MFNMRLSISCAAGCRVYIPPPFPSGSQLPAFFVAGSAFFTSSFSFGDAPSNMSSNKPLDWLLSSRLTGLEAAGAVAARLDGGIRAWNVEGLLLRLVVPFGAMFAAVLNHSNRCQRSTWDVWREE